MYPSPLILLSFLAGKTRHIALGTNMLLLPLHHPVRVAEEAAMVDAESEGRLRLGLSAGYSPTDMATFNVDPHSRAHTMETGVKVIRALLSGEHMDLDQSFSHLHGYTLFPKPVQRPSPPIYMGATVDQAVKRAARLGDELLISATQLLGDLPRMISVYHAELRQLGLLPEQKITTINRIVAVTESKSETEEAVNFFANKFLGLYDRWGHSNVTELNQNIRSPEQVTRDHFIIGEPSECIDLIQRYKEIGIGEIACLMNFGGPPRELVDKSMRLLAKHIMPHFS